MAGEQRNPRNVKRLQSLEADLKQLRDSTEALVVERNELQKRLAEAEKTLRERKDSSDAEAQIRDAIAAFEKLVERGLIDKPRRGTLAEYIQLAAKRLEDLTKRLQEAERKIDQLEADRKALEDKLASGEAALKEALTKITDLQQQIDTRLAESERRAAELEKTLAQANATIAELQGGDDTIRELIEENKRLAEQIESMSGDLAVVMTTAEDAKQGLETARAETEARIRAELGTEIQQIMGERDLLTQQLNIANQQLSGQGTLPILPPDRVAELINNLMGRMQTNLSGMRIRDGEVKLKVGFGAAGTASGFVIPTTDSPQSAIENLQELTIRFDRSLGQTGEL